VWSVNASVTIAVDTDARKGTNSIKNTIAAGFTTGVASYENFSSVDLTSYTYLRYYIKSDVATTAGGLVIRLSEQNAGGTGATYASYNVPALVAGVWKEVSVALASPDADNGGTYPDDLNAVLSVSLVVGTDIGAQVVNIDDVMCNIITTGDEDDSFTSEVINDLYVYSNNIAPLMYWDQSTATTTILYAGCTLATKCLRRFGERLCMYNVTDTNATPQRVQWTIVGGISTTPLASDWTGTGSGNTDLEGVMGTDHIMTAEKLGNYMIIYGERTIASQEYVGVVSDPFAFYIRVTNRGVVAPNAVVNLGNEHIFLGWEDVYSYKGGREATAIGDNIRDELFAIVDPQYINRSFVVYDAVKDEVRVYIPTSGNEVPNVYFSYNRRWKSWSRGTRSYTGFGGYTFSTADTWASAGASATATWNEQDVRWDSIVLQSLAPARLFGDSSGVVTYEDATELDLAGTAIDGWFETKDFVTGEGYR
ncbi:hypothetical protein LCGC14_2559410, partial [marine sediment metagenome]